MIAKTLIGAAAPIARILSWPLRRSFRATEKALPRLFHPEEIMNQSPQTKELWNLTMNLFQDVRVEERPYHKLADNLFPRHGIHSDVDKNNFFTLLEWMNVVDKPPTKKEVLRFTPGVRNAVVEHLRSITNPIWRTAKEVDPDVGFVPGYITHFPTRSARRMLEREKKALTNQIKDLESANDPAALNSLSSLKANLVHIESRLGNVARLEQISHIDETLTPQRYGLLQSGGYYGPLNEHRRIAKAAYGYNKNYEEIMHDYISGAFRKIGLDRYMPAVKRFFKPMIADSKGKLINNPNYIKDDWLRTYAYDFVQAQRGTLGTKSRVFINAALNEIFPAAGESRLLSRSVSEVTRLNYLLKIGLSARFPLVNLTQPVLTTYPLVGTKIFVQSLWESVFNRGGIWNKAKEAGVIFEPELRRAVSEFFAGEGGRVGKAVSKVEKVATFPATFSEMLNRVVSYAAGTRKAAALGLKGEEAKRFAARLVDDSQFRYQKEAMPLFMSHPLGRVIGQFRTFTANYVNYLTKLFRNRATDPEGDEKLLRAIGALMVLSGTSAFPMWPWVRNKLVRTAGIDIGDVNPLEWSTEQLGLTPGINLGSSLEPFNFPYTPYNLLGPTIGPVTELAFGLRQDPDEAYEEVRKFVGGIAPPLAAYRHLFEEKARKVTPAKPEGRIIGERPTLEKLYLRPSLESVRSNYIRLVGSAIVGGRSDLMREYIKEARAKGVLVDSEFMRVARAYATKRRR